MYQPGDLIVYGIHGVCRILDREERIVDRKTIPYFVLEPLEQPGSRFLLPSENKTALAKIRPLIRADELTTLLQSTQVLENVWIQDESKRKQRYKELITSADFVSLLQMVISLYDYKETQLAAGKKLHLCDENFLRDARRVLDSEMVIVLNLEREAIPSFIRSVLVK